MEDGETDPDHDYEGAANNPAVTVVLAALAIVLLGIVVGVVLLLLRR
jgi:hypothetical protein